MATPRLTPDEIAQVSGLVAQYISVQRDRYAPRAIPLSSQQKNAVAGFFSREILDGARLLVLQGERVANPDFYPMLRNLGFTNLPDQSTMVAITFSDVVVSHESFSDGLLFHELVHVEQYRQLGIPRFSELYVTGFPNGGSYDAIPLGSMRTRSAVALNKIPQGYSPWVMKCKIGLPKDDYDERFGQRTSSRHRPHGAGYLADRPKRVQELVC